MKERGQTKQHTEIHSVTRNKRERVCSSKEELNLDKIES